MSTLGARPAEILSVCRGDHERKEGALIRSLILPVLCLWAFFTRADGCFLPQVAVQNLPEIPAQRAAVVWKDGRETLVIASALDSESQKLGWVIPLPNPPEQIEKAFPGALKTLSFCLQPRIVHDLRPLMSLSVMLVFLAVSVTSMVVVWHCSLVEILVALGLFFFLGSAIFPATGSAGARPSVQGTVEIERTASVGNYEVAVLRAKNADGLNAWLSANGLAALPASAEQTVQNYIREGWVFAAIVLSRGETGANTPHPIKISFKTDEPVYPMRLTAVAGGHTKLELFVIAGKRAACERLETEFCDRFDLSSFSIPTDDYETAEVYSGRSSRVSLGHAAVCDLLWSGCVITKLSGDIGADRMTDDIRFRWEEADAFRRRFFTPVGAKSVERLVYLWGFGGVFVWALIAYRKSAKESAHRGPGRFFLRAVLPALAGVVAVAHALYAVLPKLEESAFHVSYAWARGSFLRSVVMHEFREDPELPGRSEQEIAETLQARLAGKWAETKKTGHAMRFFAGGPVRVEDSPGNFTVEKTGDRLVVRVYDSAGRAMTNVVQATQKVPSE
jgi:hypothetical protein